MTYLPAKNPEADVASEPFLVIREADARIIESQPTLTRAAHAARILSTYETKHIVVQRSQA